MLHRLKNLLICFAALSYAATVLFGPALHSLAGCDHDSCCDLGEFLSLCHSSGAPSTPALASGDHDHHEHDHANCPICQFQAQGQILTVPASVAWTFHLLAYRCDESTRIVASCAVASYRSRAPPIC